MKISIPHSYILIDAPAYNCHNRVELQPSKTCAIETDNR